MSASAMLEAFDTQMSDFNEEDAVMLIGTSSSTENWFNQTATHMDEDSNIGDASDTQEVEMIGDEETIEYDMEEDPSPHVTNSETEVIDTEVYDAIQASPSMAELSGAADNTSRIQDTDGLVLHTQSPMNPYTEPVLQHTDDTAVAATTFVNNDLVTPAAAEQAALDNSQNSNPLELSEKDLAHADPPDVHEAASVPENTHFIDEESGTKHSIPSEPVPEDLTTVASEGRPEPTSELKQNSDASFVSERKLIDETATTNALGNVDGPSDSAQSTSAGHRAEESKGIEQTQETQEVQEIQPPPPIMLSLRVTSDEGEQPDFVLFTNFEQETIESKEKEDTDSEEEPLVLLQHQPHLFYEPISAVFEAFRQEEYFTHLEELAESEMILSAHELQLSISEVR